MVRLTVGNHLFQMPMEECMGFVKPGMPATTSSNAFSLLVHWTCLMVVALRRTTLSCNGIEGCSGLHWSPSSARDISEFVFCIASGQYAKSKFDWEQETPQQCSAALSTAQSLHSGTLLRPDISGFQMPDHYSARRRAA